MDKTIRSIIAWLNGEEPQKRSSVVGERRVVKIQPRVAEQVRSRQVVRERVAPTRGEPLWRTRGWRQVDKTWYGVYKVGNRTWDGHAEWSGGFYNMYIKNPPAKLEKHHCYVSKGDGIYFVHFVPLQPYSISAGIGAVEHQIAQALGQTQ